MIHKIKAQFVMSIWILGTIGTQMKIWNKNPLESTEFRKLWSVAVPWMIYFIPVKMELKHLENNARVRPAL